MNGDDAAYAVWSLLALVLVGSSIVARRLSTGRVVKLALIWVAIFAFAVLAFVVVASWRASNPRGPEQGFKSITILHNTYYRTSL